MKNLKFAASLTFMFGFRLLLPAPSFAYIMQDVQNYLISHPAPSGCSNRTEEYAANGQQGVKVLQRCGASTTIRQISKDYIYGQAVAVSKFPHSVARNVYFCEDYKNYDYNIGLSEHTVTSGYVYINHYIPDRITYCDGRVEQRDVLNRYPYQGYLDVPDCLDVLPYVVNDCTQLDTLLADFFPITNCIDGDYDGFYKYDAIWCPQGNDCDDGNLKINPDTVWHRDIDNDRYPDLSYQPVGPQCQRPSGYQYYNELKKYEHDCDDTKSDLNPEHPCGKKILKYVSGSDQEGDIRSPLEDPFVVNVVDEQNNPATGNVAWEVTTTPPDAQGYGLSDTSGLSSTLTFGDTAGNYLVTVTCTDCTENRTVTFKARAKELKIEIDAEETSLSPLTDADNTGPSGEKEIDFSKASKTGVTVKVTRDDEPYPDYPVSLQSIPVPNAGGHDHDNDRRKGNFKTIDGADIPDVLRTDNNGIIEVIYESSGIAGIETVEASSAVVPDIKDGEDVTLKIKGLKPMPIPSDNLPFSNYYLVGSYGEPGVSSMHRNNHYGTWGTVNALVQIANGFNRLFPGNPFYYNDMSLPWGGPFDVYNNWSNPHLGHREGKNVDMRFTNVDTVGKYLEFTKLLLRNNGRITSTHSDHWHIHFAQ